MKLDGIQNEWPTPTTMTGVKSFLGFGNFDTELTQNNGNLTKLQNKRNENRQGNENMVMMPEGLFLNLLDHKFNDERTFEDCDEQFDQIKTLSVHGLKTLHNHFSKVTTATSVNDIIAVNITNTNLQKWITMAQDMNIIINNMINILSGRRHNIWKDISKDWLIWILQLPNRNHNTLRCLKPLQKSNKKRVKRSLFW